MTDTNEIIIDPKKCIYVKNGDTSEIYFSNYYLKQVIAKDPSFDSSKLFKFNFENSNFMNHTLIDVTNQNSIPDIRSAINTVPNVTTSTALNPNTLDLSLYSKLTYTPGTTPTLKLETTIEEDYIIESIKGNDGKSIFNNKAQVRRFLKYNGWWINAQPTLSEFDSRLATTMPDKPTAISVEGGKKTTTRRRGKTGYNKHRKSNRRR